MHQANTTPFEYGTIRPGFILAAAVVMQTLAAAGLVQYGSVGGGLNARDFAALVACVGVAVCWIVMLVTYRHLCPHLIGLRTPRRLGIMAGVTAGGILVWLLPINLGVRQFVSINSLLVNLLLIATLADGKPRQRKAAAILSITALGIGLLPMGFTVLVRMPFSPDEAHWADFASTAFATTNPGVYARTWLMAPTQITPGVGWSVAAYGWFLEHITFNIRVGRSWNFASYLVAFAGIALLSWRLYGRWAALASLIFAGFSATFIPVFDYRPDHQIPAAAAFAFLLVIVARQSLSVRRARLFDTLAGIVAVSALQLHAVAIALTAGLGLFYGGTWLLAVGKSRRICVYGFAPLLAYTLGVALGGLLYFAFNIAPVGGVGPFLAQLGGRLNLLYTIHPMFSWPSLPELALIAFGFTVLLLRRNRSDRLFLGMLVAYIVALLALDTQGYRSAVSAFYAVVAGAFVAGGLGEPYGRRSVWTLLSILTLLGAQTMGFVDWQAVLVGLRTGVVPNYVYADMRDTLTERLSENDTLVSTHLLIWALGNRSGYYSVSGELTGAQRWNVPLDEVWERIEPTVVVDIPTQMVLDPGLQTYMQRHGFTLCESVPVQHLHLNFYRPDCSFEEAATS